MKQICTAGSSIPEQLAPGFAEIRQEFPERFTDKQDGIPVSFIQEEQLSRGGLSIQYSGTSAEIRCGRISDAFRALGILFSSLECEEDIHAYEEQARIKTLGMMLDMSRNGVCTPETVRSILRRTALMGINMCMLYTEDTYEIEGEPFFGYLRGSYTRDELARIDGWANSLGIEMIPCIQTLGHCEQMLQWPAYKELQDTSRVLLAEEDRTYAFIEKMIRAVSGPFRSDRIHIGMDEAWDLGQGRYRELKGEKRTFDIMNAHLARVREICAGLGLKPIIWSDMYFRLGSKIHSYYDPEWTIPEDVVDDIPKDVQLVYWDYDHTDPNFYSDWIDKHRSLGSEPLVAPGAATWNQFWASVPFAEHTVNPCMEACRDKGIQEVFITAWGDNGMECDIFSALPVIQLFAENGYADSIDMDRVRKHFRGSCDADYDAWRRASYIDYPPCLQDPETKKPNPSKYLLYSDVLLGLWDREVDTQGTEDHYSSLAEELSEKAEETVSSKRLLFPAQIARVLSIKTVIREKLVQAYAQKNTNRLRELADGDLALLRKEVDALWKTHRSMWLSTYKPFGLEVIEMRYGALKTRLESLDMRLRDCIAGKTDSIPEFETEIRPVYSSGPGDVPRLSLYTRIISPSCIV